MAKFDRLFAQVYKITHLGGKGSGHTSHRGRPGKVGGSLPSRYISSIRSRKDVMENPFNPRALAFLDDLRQDVKANVEIKDFTGFYGNKEPAVYFNINVPETSRGKGYGTQVMQELITEANKHGVILVGEPQAFGPGKKMNNKQLWSWYLKLGFTKEKDWVVYHPNK